MFLPDFRLIFVNAMTTYRLDAVDKRTKRLVLGLRAHVLCDDGLGGCLDLPFRLLRRFLGSFHLTPRSDAKTGGAGYAGVKKSSLMIVNC